MGPRAACDVKICGRTRRGMGTKSSTFQLGHVLGSRYSSSHQLNERDNDCTMRVYVRLNIICDDIVLLCMYRVFRRAFYHIPSTAGKYKHIYIFIYICMSVCAQCSRLPHIMNLSNIFSIILSIILYNRTKIRWIKKNKHSYV